MSVDALECTPHTRYDVVMAATEEQLFLQWMEDQLSALQARTGWSYAKIAVKAGVSEQQLRRWRTGSFTPRRSMLIKFCHNLNIDAAEPMAILGYPGPLPVLSTDGTDVATNQTLDDQQDPTENPFRGHDTDQLMESISRLRSILSSSTLTSQGLHEMTNLFEEAMRELADRMNNNDAASTDTQRHSA